MIRGTGLSFVSELREFTIIERARKATDNRSLLDLGFDRAAIFKLFSSRLTLTRLPSLPGSNYINELATRRALSHVGERLGRISRPPPLTSGMFSRGTPSISTSTDITHQDRGSTQMVSSSRKLTKSFALASATPDSSKIQTGEAGVYFLSSATGYLPPVRFCLSSLEVDKARRSLTLSS